MFGYFNIVGYFCKKSGFMKKSKPYEKTESMGQSIGELIVAYMSSENDLDIVWEERDDTRYAITSEELFRRHLYKGFV